MTRDEIVEFIEETAPEEEIVLFDGLEKSFIGVAERFENGGHRYFAVYDYEKMVDAIAEDGEGSAEERYEDAREYIDFNVIGLYAGEGTPAILYRMETR